MNIILVDVNKAVVDALKEAQQDDPDFTIDGFMRSDVNSIRDKTIDLDRVFR